MVTAIPDLGQVIQDLTRILVRKNVAIDMDLDATLAQLEPRSNARTSSASALLRTGGVGSGVKSPMCYRFGNN